jgi:hypothetical protein
MKQEKPTTLRYRVIVTKYKTVTEKKLRALFGKLRKHHGEILYPLLFPVLPLA